MVEEQVLAHTQEVALEGLQIEVIRNLDAFYALAPEWTRLAERWAVDPVFLSHTWFRTWWESFGRGKELHIVTVRQRRELVAVAPMMRTRATIYGLKLNTIQAIYNPHTPRYDVIVGENQNPQLYRAIWKNFLEQDHADAVILSQIPNGSRTISMFEELGKTHGWISGQWPAPPSPFISLVDGYDGFLNNLKSSSRYNLRKRYDRLKKKGVVDVEVVTRPDQIPEAMKDGLRIEAAAWKGELGTAIISDPSVAEFYIQLAQREAELGRVRLTFLRVDWKTNSVQLPAAKRKEAVWGEDRIRPRVPHVLSRQYAPQPDSAASLRRRHRGIRFSRCR